MSPARIRNASPSSGESKTSSNAATVRSKTRLARGYGTSSAGATAATASDGRWIVCDIDRLPVGVHVERLCPGRAPPGARVALPAEGDVRLEAVGRPVHLDAPGDDPADELLPPGDTGRAHLRAQRRAA